MLAPSSNEVLCFQKNYKNLCQRTHGGTVSTNRSAMKLHANVVNISFLLLEAEDSVSALASKKHCLLDETKHMDHFHSNSLCIGL